MNLVFHIIFKAMERYEEIISQTMSPKRKEWVRNHCSSCDEIYRFDTLNIL